MSFEFGSKSPALIDGWLVLALPEVERRHAGLRRRVVELREDETCGVSETPRVYPTVKLFASVRRLLTSTIPAEPDAPEFKLEASLSRFRRARKHGLPPHPRLFWVFSSRLRVIIILYLDDETTLRKEGASSDPYGVAIAVISALAMRVVIEKPSTALGKAISSRFGSVMALAIPRAPTAAGATPLL